MNTRGFIFDGPGVLYDSSLWRRWLLKLLTRLGMHTHYDVFYRTWDYEYAAAVLAGRRSWRSALESFLRSAGLTPCQIDEVIPALRAVRNQIEADLRPMPGVTGTLAVLEASGFRMAVAADTEATAAEFNGRLKRLGIAERFAGAVSSTEVGDVMPSSAVYFAALAAIGLPPDQVAFVSALPEHISGAKQMGLSTVAVDCDLTGEADCHVERICQLVESFGAVPMHRRAG
jgi:FMN phosphatase YigB (HAD superfamily)